MSEISRSVTTSAPVPDGAPEVAGAIGKADVSADHGAKDAYRQALELKFTDPKTYHSQEHQEKLRRMAEERQSAAPPPPATDVHGVVPAPRMSDWLNAGNDASGYDDHLQLVGRVNDVLVAMPEETRTEINSSFDRLPEKVQSAALAAFAEKRARGAVRLSEDDMQRIQAVPAFATLAREWGQEAPRRFGALRARILHATSRLDDADFNAALDWLDDLPPSAVAAVGRVLAQ